MSMDRVGLGKIASELVLSALAWGAIVAGFVFLLPAIPNKDANLDYFIEHSISLSIGAFSIYALVTFYRHRKWIAADCVAFALGVYAHDLSFEQIVGAIGRASQ